MPTFAQSARKLFAIALAVPLLVVALEGAAQTPPGGVPIPSSADYGDPDDQFGYEIELEEDWAITTGLAGEAYYVYQRVGSIWTRRQRIVPPTLGQVGPASIQLRANRLLISRGFGEGFANEGRVWVYERAAPGQDFQLVATVAPDSGQAGDRFGYGLALSEDRLFVGAPARDETVVDQGVVYVFQRIGANWVQEAKLVMPDPTVSDRFGFALDFDGQDLLVGARQHRGNPVTGVRRGAVYVYRYLTGSWTQVQKLEQPAAVTQGIQFGYDIKAENGRAAIAAPAAGIPAMYFAQRDGSGVWSRSVLPAPLAGTGQFSTFLGAVDIEGDLIAASVQSALDPGLATPGPTWAVVWRESAGTWTVTAQRQRPDGDGAPVNSVRLGNGWMLVGASNDDASARNEAQGSILSFSLSNGVATPAQRIWHGNGNLPDYLGHFVAIDGDHALTTAPGADSGAVVDRGALHFLRRDGQSAWSFVQALPSSADQGLPLAADMAGNLAYVSYPENEVAGLAAPVVRVYQRDGSGVWAALCDMQPPAGTTRFEPEKLAASSQGVMAATDGGRIAWFPAPSGAACAVGSLMPAAPNGGSYFGVALEGGVALLEWFATVNGAQRAGVDVYDLVGANWNFAHSFVGSTINGLAAEAYEYPRSDGGNRLLIRHLVPVSSIDRRNDIQLWERPSMGNPFVLARTFTPSTATGGFDFGIFVGSLVMLADPGIGNNSGLAVYDPLTGAHLQNLIPIGLQVEDGRLDQADAANGRGVFSWRRQNRSGVNHAGMLYFFEPDISRGGTPVYNLSLPASLPPAGTDALFFDGLETAAF